MSRLACLIVLTIVSIPVETWAQGPAVQVVQQPVVRRFAVGTSVSVPDGGRAYLGGVGKASSGRKTAGPLRSGTNSGFEMSSSSQSVSVHVLDFEAMDQALLESANRDVAARTDRRKINPRVEMAWQSMQARQRKQR